MSKVTRWGIIGPGRIAHRFASAFTALGNSQIQAVASSSLQKAQDFASQHAIAQAYGSYEALVEDSNVDVVYIASVHRFHFAQALMCLQAGKPVLCEKPLTVNAAETEQLVAVAREKGVFLMEALWTRYLPIYQVVREWLDSGIIGDPRLLTSTFGFIMPREEADRMLNPQLAGGALLDMGVYPIALSQWVLKRNPKSFVASGYKGPTGVDEMLTAVLDYGDGCMSKFCVNFISRNVNDFFVYGSKDDAYIRIHPMFWDTTQATLSVNGKETTVQKPFNATGFEYEIEEAERCLHAGLIESPNMTHDETLANMRLMDEIRAQMGLKYPFE